MQSTLLFLRWADWTVRLKIFAMRMKKLIAASLAILLSSGIVIVSEAAVLSPASVYAASSSSRVSIPTGVFFNGSNFVKVESTWVRICIGNQSSEYDIRNAEIDPSGNYALVLSNGASMTIYSNGRSLHYDGTTYTKK